VRDHPRFALTDRERTDSITRPRATATLSNHLLAGHDQNAQYHSWAGGSRPAQPRRVDRVRGNEKSSLVCGFRRCLAVSLQEMFDGLAQIFEFAAIRSRDVVGRP
jgi:hypothetical protein